MEPPAGSSARRRTFHPTRRYTTRRIERYGDGLACKTFSLCRQVDDRALELTIGSISADDSGPLVALYI